MSDDLLNETIVPEVISWDAITVHINSIFFLKFINIIIQQGNYAPHKCNNHEAKLIIRVYQKYHMYENIKCHIYLYTRT